MIDAELQLEALLGVRQRRRHHAGVVDEGIDSGFPLQESGRSADAVEVALVARHEAQVGARCELPDAGDSLVRLVLGAAGQYHTRSASRQNARGFEADAGIGPGADEALAGLA